MTLREQAKVLVNERLDHLDWSPVMLDITTELLVYFAQRVEKAERERCQGIAKHAGSEGLAALIADPTCRVVKP